MNGGLKLSSTNDGTWHFAECNECNGYGEGLTMEAADKAIDHDEGCSFRLVRAAEQAKRGSSSFAEWEEEMRRKSKL